jgi:hypothetical protein
VVAVTRDFVVIVAEAVTYEPGLDLRAVLEVPAMHEPATATRMVEIAALGERLSALRLCDAEALTTIRRSLEQHGQLAALTLFAEPRRARRVALRQLRTAQHRTARGGEDGDHEPPGTPEQMQAVVHIANNCINFAEEVCDAVLEHQTPDPNTNLAGIAGACIARGAQALMSTTELAQRGFVGDALTVARTIVELAIDLGYIESDAGTLIRRFRDYADVRDRAMAEAIRPPGCSWRSRKIAARSR